MKKKNWIKRILPQTLLGRSLLIIIIPVLLIQLFVTFIFFDRHWVRMTNRLAFAVAGEISIISELIDDAKDHKDIDEMKCIEPFHYHRKYLEFHCHGEHQNQ